MLQHLVHTAAITCKNVKWHLHHVLERTVTEIWTLGQTPCPSSCTFWPMCHVMQHNILNRTDLTVSTLAGKVMKVREIGGSIGGIPQNTAILMVKICTWAFDVQTLGITSSCILLCFVKPYDSTLRPKATSYRICVSEYWFNFTISQCTNKII